MKVLVAQRCGFCPGVRNAISLAQKTLAKHSPVYSLGPIIHNHEVVGQLEQAGLKIVNDVDKIDSGTVLIRSHGATLKNLKKIKEKGLNTVDATCVLVKSVQITTKSLHEQGYRVVIIGDENHPEVEAIVGFTDDVVVIADQSDLHKLPKNGKLGIICQTTQSPEHFTRMIGAIAARGFAEMKVINTLCKEAIKRQSSAVQLCQQVDIMFVLGGLHSANTRKLAELCKKYNPQTFHLQNWKELDKNILFGNNTAGVTAGASTPGHIIAEFVDKLKAFDSSAGSEIKGK